MVRRYPKLKDILDQKGWELTVIFGIEKLRRRLEKLVDEPTTEQDSKRSE